MSEHKPQNLIDVKELIVVEELTVPVVIRCLGPYLARHQDRRAIYPIVYYIDADASGATLGRLVCQLSGWECQRLQFKLADIFDEQDRLVELRIFYRDMFEILDSVVKNPVMSGIFQHPAVKNNPCLTTYLKKQVVGGALHERNTVLRLLELIQIAHWQAGRLGYPQTEKVLFANERPFSLEFRDYARSYHVKIINTGRHYGDGQVLRDLISEHRLRAWYYAYKSGGIPKLVKCLVPSSKQPQAEEDKILAAGPKLWVESYGQWNLDAPQYFSDLFFWQESELEGADCLISFNVPADPLNIKKREDLRKNGMTAVLLNPKAVTGEREPYFDYIPRMTQNPVVVPSAGRQDRWLKRQGRDYALERDYWIEFFRRYNVKLHTTWYKLCGRHCTITDALRCVGGISTVYQRSWEEFPMTATALSVDVAFGYSRLGVERERLSQSVVPYYVVTGYLGDHRFERLKPQATEIRQQLLAKGARRIIGYLDENSMDDSRWHTGHEIMRANYEFLLNKVLTTPWLGLAIKPKMPMTLRRRLGPVVPFLDEAIATGRCQIIEGGHLTSSIPPALVALVSDVAIHGSLCAMTAGLECALTGTPTLLFDTEGWPDSPMYGLGLGKVVFKDWDHLWQVCSDHGNTSAGVPGFGDWSPMIDQFDPFRDGRAAERMGIYLKWLLDGLKVGLSRETVMADAAEQYIRRWGRDKIASINIKNQVNSRQSKVNSEILRPVC